MSMNLGLVRMLAVMNPGVAVLAMLAILALLILSLFASGIFKISIERSDDEPVTDEELERDLRRSIKEIKELENKGWRNRFLKVLAWITEKLLEIWKKKNSGGSEKSSE